MEMTGERGTFHALSQNEQPHAHSHRTLGTIDWMRSSDGDHRGFYQENHGDLAGRYRFRLDREGVAHISVGAYLTSLCGRNDLGVAIETGVPCERCLQVAARREADDHQPGKEAVAAMPKGA